MELQLLYAKMDDLSPPTVKETSSSGENIMTGDSSILLYDAVERLLCTWANGPADEESELRKVVEELLADPASVLDFNDDSIGNLLSCCIQDQDDTIFRLLMSHSNGGGRDPLARWPSTDVLTWAASNGTVSLLKRLLGEIGAEPDAKDALCRTPLSFAAEAGAETVVELLSSSQLVEIDSRDVNGCTPLWWAVMHAQENVTKLLLAHNAAVPSINDSGQAIKIRFDAAEHGWTNILEVLLGQVGSTTWLASIDHEGRTLLTIAAENGNELVLKSLLRKKGCFGLNSRDKSGRTAVWCAASNGHDAVLRMLLANDVDVNVVDNRGITPLMEAVDQLLSRHRYPASHRSKAAARRASVISHLLAHPAVDTKSMAVGCLQRLLWHCAGSGFQSITAQLVAKDDRID